MLRSLFQEKISLRISILANLSILSTASAALVGGTLQISGPGGRFPDVAYGNASHQYLVVWADYTPPQVRIFGAMVSGTGAVSSPILVSDGGLGGLFPAVAFNSSSNEFLVTWDDDGAHGGVIYGRRVRGSDGALLGNNFPIGSLYGGIRSAVAWSPASECYLVVFWGPGPANTASEIYAQRVSGSGVLLSTNVNISNDAVFSGYPAVAWGAAGDQFLVTWDNDDGNIYGRRVAATNGAPLGGTIIITSAGVNDRSCVAYDPVHSRWLVQYNNGGNAGYSYDQFGQFVNADGLLESGPVPIAHTPGFEGDTQFGGDIAFELGAQRFFSSFALDSGMGAQECLTSGAQLGAQVVLGTGYYTSLNNAADPDTHRFLTAWEGLFAGSYQIFGRLYAASLEAPKNFKANPGNFQNQLTWQNPPDPHFAGTIVRVKTTGVPASPVDGTLVVDKAGIAGQSETFNHTNLENWTSYYYAAFAHDNGTNYSPVEHAIAMPRPPAATLHASDFSTGTDGWTLDVWRAGTLGFGSIEWDATTGSVVVTGAGETNDKNSCTREGAMLTRIISTAGYTNIQIEYEVMASLFARPSGPSTGGCTVLEDTLEDKLVLYYSTTGTNGPWSVGQILTEGVELPTGWKHEFVNLPGINPTANNENFSLRFQWQFNHGADTGCVANIHVLSGAVTGLIPAMRAAPASFERTVTQGGTLANDVIKVSNAGGGILDFSVSNNVSWLSAIPEIGVSLGPEYRMNLIYDVADLSVGDYAAAIQIASSNGANGPLVLPVTLHVIPPECISEPFDYYDGNLTTMGAANWSGTAAESMVIDAGRLKASGGSGTTQAQRAVSCPGSNGVVAAGLKISSGGGSGDIFWSIYFDDSLSNNLARFYGSTRIVRGRIGGAITPDMPLSGSNVWDDLYVEINTVTQTSQFFFNGVSFGTLQQSGGSGSGVAVIRIELTDRPTASADHVLLDQLFVGHVDETPPVLRFSRPGGQMLLSWPAERRGSIIQTTTQLQAPNSWMPITNPAIVNGSFLYSPPLDVAQRFFRLLRN